MGPPKFDRLQGWMSGKMNCLFGRLIEVLSIKDTTYLPNRKKYQIVCCYWRVFMCGTSVMDNMVVPDILNKLTPKPWSLYTIIWPILTCTSAAEQCKVYCTSVMLIWFTFNLLFTCVYKSFQTIVLLVQVKCAIFVNCSSILHGLLQECNLMHWRCSSLGWTVVL